MAVKTYTLNEVKSAFSEAVLTNNLYNISVIKPAKGVKIDPTIFLRVKSSDVPVSKTELLELELQNHPFIGASKTTYKGSITLTAYEGVNAEFLKMLTEMDESRNRRTKDDITGFGLNIADQKSDFRLTRVGSNGEAVRTYDLVGAIVKIDSVSGLSADGLSASEVTFTLDYDGFFEY